jgi:hypothetical protein
LKVSVVGERNAWWGETWGEGSGRRREEGGQRGSPTGCEIWL